MPLYQLTHGTQNAQQEDSIGYADGQTANNKRDKRVAPHGAATHLIHLAEIN